MNKADKIDILNATISIVDILQARFNSKYPLTHLNAALYHHRASLRGDRTTFTDMARVSGVPKSTVSHLIRQIPHVTIVSDPNDDRAKLIVMDDVKLRTAYLSEIELILDHHIGTSCDTNSRL